MSETAIIVVNKDSLEAAYSPAAFQLKDEALESAALIARVSSASENDTANAALLKLSNLRRLAEKAHKAGKEPYLRACQFIDGKKNEFLADVIAEERRLGQEMGNYQAILAEQRRAAEQASRLEQERIQREAQEAIRRAAQEEAERNAKIAREQAEAQRMAREATNKIAREEAQRRQSELDMLRKQSEAKSLEEMDAARVKMHEQQAAIAPAPVSQVRAVHQIIKPDYDIVVTDVHLLYRHHPNLVDLEPRMADIKSFVKQGGKVKGITKREVFNVTARASKQQAAIEV